ncbi:MAG: diguanylate cyclase [Syntrophorhabdaceae bacterium]|nr:diguanylate cyclase [Syntrophorhabdaceae bacterium]
MYVFLLFCLYLTSLKSYLLFHTIVEVFSIVIACGIFLLAWNTKSIINNNYLLFLGIAYLFIGGIDFVHTLAYKGMNIFKGYDSNLPTQLWISARYMESLSLLVAPIFFKKRLNPHVLFITYFFVTSVLLSSVFLNIFPDCYIEGRGLTLFKIVNEYIISIILFISIIMLLKFRNKFENLVLKYILWSIIFTILSELAFTFYIGVYDLSNMIGHYFKFISFYLIYKAIFQTGVARPYSFLLKDLKDNEALLKEAHSIAKIGHWVFDIKTGTRKWSDEIFKILGINPLEGELPLEKQKDFVHPQDWDKYYETIQRAIKEGIPYEMEFRVIRPDKNIRWVNAIGNVTKDDKGNVIRLFGTAQDITERKEIEEALSNERKRFLNLVESAPFGLILVDKNGNLQYTNPKFKELFGYSIKDVSNLKNWFIKAFPDPDERELAIKLWLDDLKSALESQSTPRIFTVKAKDGKEKIINFISIQLETGEQIITCYDITEQKQIEKKLETLSLTDELTGLYNRRGFMMLAQKQMKIAERNKKGMTLFFIDLDQMKEINDSLGHQAGDMALIETASILKDVFRESDIIGRIGGDEFAALALDTTEETKDILLKRLNNTINAYNTKKDRKYNISFSIGISVYNPKFPVNLDTLMSSADDLMYKEKKKRKEINKN